MIGETPTLHGSRHLTAPVMIPFLANFVERVSNEHEYEVSGGAFRQTGTFITKVRRETTDDR